MMTDFHFTFLVNTLSANQLKENPNLYHGHCRRSFALKTKQGVSNVVDGAGRLTELEG